MHAKDAISTTQAMADRLLGMYLSDLTDAELLVRAVDGQNHIAWQIGHLICTSHRMLNSIKAGASPPLPDGFEAHHAREEGAPGDDDASHFLSKAEYEALWTAQREATRTVVDALTDADLDAPGPERLRPIAPTVGTALVFLSGHEMMHLGQFVAVRRKLKKPILI